jgi:hypothetical protein
MAEIANEEADASGGRRKAGRTTIVPMADGDPTVPPARRAALGSLTRERVADTGRRQLTAAKPPIPGTRQLRLALSGILFLMSLATLGGAVVVLLLWQQYRDSGVLTTQIDRAWDLVENLRVVERALAFGVVPVALAWIVLATLNARRATGHRRNPAVPAIALVVGVVGIWMIGAEIVAVAESWIERSVGYLLQAVGVVLPLLALERVAEAAEARRRPMHVTALLAIAAVVVLQERGGLSTLVPTDDSDAWGMIGVDLVILALIQALGALGANETARAIEEGAQHRYQLRSRFSESVLAQAGLD